MARTFYATGDLRGHRLLTSPVRFRAVLCFFPLLRPHCTVWLDGYYVVCKVKKVHAKYSENVENIFSYFQVRGQGLVKLSFGHTFLLL